MQLNSEKIRIRLKQLQLKEHDFSAALTSVQIEVVAETGSTNTDLMRRAQTLAGPVLLVALHQTAGRGRAGRTWHSEAGAVLTFSLAWHFSLTAQQLMGLPLVVGLAVAETLREMGVPVSLKWPNDILKDGKKLGGILLESCPGAEGGSWAVIGIGLNLSVPDALEARIGQAVADALWLAQMDRNHLLAALTHALQVRLAYFEQVGFAGFVARWNHLHAFANQVVTVQDQGRVLQQGVALGVDDSACLLLQTETGLARVHAGDVSLRLVG